MLDFPDLFNPRHAFVAACLLIAAVIGSLALINAAREMIAERRENRK